MHLLSTLLFITLTTAISLRVPAKRDDPGPIIWKSRKGGNTNVRFGDGKVYVGGCKPKDVIATLKDNCYNEGFCNSASWSMQCISDDSATHTVTITAPEGQYQPPLKKKLIEAIQAALGTKGVTQSKTVTAMSGGGCVGCPWTAKQIRVYYMPSTIGISRLNKGTVPDVITLKIDNEDSKDDGGMCEILTGIGGAVAGSVNGVAGGIFSLAGLACKAI